MHSIGHIERQPLAFCSCLYNFAVDVALCWRCQILGFEDLEQKSVQEIAHHDSRKTIKNNPTYYLYQATPKPPLVLCHLGGMITCQNTTPGYLPLKKKTELLNQLCVMIKVAGTIKSSVYKKVTVMILFGTHDLCKTSAINFLLLNSWWSWLTLLLSESGRWKGVREGC